MSSTANADWTRFGYDASRSGDDPHPTGITAANVATLVRQQVPLPGTVDSSPIYLQGVTVGGTAHDTLFVTTSYGITLAIDARTGATLWQYTPPSYAHLAGTGQITTAAPVADPSRQWIYASSPDGKIEKLSVADGSAVWRVSITRRPEREKISSALNYADGHVIATTSGFFDRKPYQGHVAFISPAGHVDAVWNALCSRRARLIDPASCQSGASIWGRAGAVALPGSSDLLVATSNGPWNGKTDWGDSVIEFSPAGKLTGNYAPSNQAKLNDRDLDLGSTSPAILTPKLLVQGGKDRLIRLVSLSNIHGRAPHLGHELQTVWAPHKGELFTAPAVWRRHRVWLVAADNLGTEAWVLRHHRLHAAWKNAKPGTSPVVAGGLLYVYELYGGGVRVYRPSSGKLVTTLAAGSGHWNSPIVTDGIVALPEGDANDHLKSGVIDIWRLP